MVQFKQVNSTLLFNCSQSEECASRSDETNETESKSNVLGTSLNDVHKDLRIHLGEVGVMVPALVDDEVLVGVSNLVEDRPLSRSHGAKFVFIAMHHGDRHPVDCSKVNKLRLLCALNVILEGDKLLELASLIDLGKVQVVLDRPRSRCFGLAKHSLP